MVKKLYKFPEVLFFQEGPGVRNHQYTTSGVKLLNVSNLRNGQIDLTTSDRYISENEAFNKYSHFLCDPNDFIIASSGIKIDSFNSKMGFIHQSDLPVCMNTSTIRFKVLNKEVLEIRYFMYYLKSVAFKKVLTKVVTGSAQLNFGPSHLKNMSISLPNLDVQKNIVQRLDRVNKLIEIKRKLLFLLDGLVKSRFVELFGDPNIVKSNKCVKFSSIAKIITGNTPSRKSPEYYGDYIEWIKSDNIVSTDLYISQAKEFLSEQGAVKGRIAPKDSLLMTFIAGSIRSIGNVGLCNRSVAFNQQINAIVLENDINPLYVYWLLKLFKPSIIANVEMSLKGIISKSQLENMFIPIVASNTEQEVFAKFVLQINKLKSDVQKSIDETQLLMDSLMQEYFG